VRIHKKHTPDLLKSSPFEPQVASYCNPVSHSCCTHITSQKETAEKKQRKKGGRTVKDFLSTSVGLPDPV
jgi:hypothetical protein